MKKIPVKNKEKILYALVDNVDYEYLKQFKWRIIGSGYAAYFKWVSEYKNVRPFYMHRIIMDTKKGIETDHINHNKLDNRRQNLRICSSHQNKGNLSISIKNTSGYKGVCWDKLNKKWIVNIFYNNKQFNLGRYLNKEEAAKEYNKKALELFGQFALLNQV